MLRRCRHRRTATLIEVPAHDRAPIIRAYLLRNQRPSGSAQVAREARDYFGIGAESTLAEIGSVADRYPVFQVVPADRFSVAGAPVQPTPSSAGGSVAAPSPAKISGVRRFHEDGDLRQ